MDAFPKELLENIRKHLEEEKKAVEIQISELIKQDPFSDPGRASDNAASDTEASEESDHDRFAAMISEQKDKLMAITMSLERIDNGTYGFCSHCHEMIDTDRLGILPMAVLCKQCEESKKR